MRKVDPTELCKNIQDELDGFRGFYSAGLSALGTGPHSAKRMSTLSELVFHRAYVAMECFFSAYFIGAINRDATEFLEFRRNQIMQSLEGKYTQWDRDNTTYAPPRHLPVQTVISLLDADEYNVTFSSFAQMVERSRQWLASRWHAKLSTVPVARQSIMDAARAVRNCIAHQSKFSFDRMNEALQALPETGAASSLKRQVNAVNNVGAYLKALHNGERRTDIYLDEFSEVAEAMK